MSDQTHIEWTDATWNIITGCSIKSPGCRGCYAMKLAGTRLRNHPSRAGLTQPSPAGPVWTGEVRFNEQWLDQPQRWSRARDIFVCAHGDLFHESVPDAWIDQVFAVMANSPWHRFQVLTKRARRMREYLTAPDRPRIVDELACDLADRGRIRVTDDYEPWPLRNVILMVSAERQHEADERIPELLMTPAARRGLSLEPLLGPIDVQKACTLRCPNRDCFANGAGIRSVVDSENGGTWAECICSRLNGLHWVIAGGESGPHARPSHPEWFRSLRDQCAAAGVPFLFKQWGEWAPAEAIDDNDDRDLAQQWLARDGREVNPDHGLDIFHGDTPVYRAGKKAAGRLLDGIEHNGFPEPR